MTALGSLLESEFSGGAAAPLYVDDVFSTWLYTGNGSTQTITNGIDLAGSGGMIWTKGRDVISNHSIWDSIRNAQGIYTNTTQAQSGINGIASVSSSGFNINNSAGNDQNAVAQSYASWTFRRAPKFFDIVTYTGNGTVGRQIPHNLGVTPGAVFFKKTSSVGNWVVWHRSTPLGGYAQSYLRLNGAFGINSLGNYNSAGSLVPSAQSLTVSTHFNGGNTDDDVNINGQTYVAYLFAHDTASDGFIQCGSFTTDGAGNAGPINLGWEPQYILYKRSDDASQWAVLDNMRGFVTSDYSPALFANLSQAESVTAGFINPTATGFQITNARGTVSSTYIYIAIRRPNKPPTTGTQVYNAIARTGTGAAATVTGAGFPPDLFLPTGRQAQALGGTRCFDRMRGTPSLKFNTSAAEVALGGDAFISHTLDGASLGSDGSNNELNFSGRTYINHFFRRAPGFFDVVCYTGNGVDGQLIPHNLGATPELVFVKSRTNSTNWQVNHVDGGTNYLLLNTTAAIAPITNYSPPRPTIVRGFSDITVGGNSDTNASGQTYIAYLFASVPGISKVGSYTGNGSTQTINCGFSTGTRFVLIKRTDSAGDWYVWDTARGIISANDPHLSLNTTAAEVTTNDSVDPDASGFIVNQVAATNINVNAATYIYLAIA